MEDISTAEGFVDVNDSVAEMIRYLANEPSLGLFFVQQHTRDAVPILVSAKDKVLEKCREVTYETEDLEDSISMVNSMNDAGFLIADGMNAEIKRAMRTMSRSRPKKGLISDKTFNFSKNRSNPWSPDSFNDSPSSIQQDSNSSSSYFSTVLNSAKQKASALKWPPMEITQLANSKANMFVSSPFLSVPLETEGKELISDTILEEFPASGELQDEPSSEELLLMPENYEKFKCEQEAKLEEWLGDGGSQMLGDHMLNNTIVHDNV